MSTPKLIKLSGARFDGGQLPVDSLIEIERYQATLRALAIADWQEKHPGEEIPGDLFESLSLKILSIEEGSAEVYLAFEQMANYSEQRQFAQSYFDSTLQAAYSNLPLPELPSDIEDQVREDISEIGSSLKPGQSIEIAIPDFDINPVVITIESRKVAREKLLLDTFWLTDDEVLKNNLSIELGTVAGRVTMLDANSHTFVLESLIYGPIKGWYKNKPELLEDFKRVLDDSSNGPVTKLEGQIQFRNGVPWRIKETSEIQLFTTIQSEWSADLLDFASLPFGWAGPQLGQTISFLALEAADKIMMAISNSGQQLPALFPTDEGGVLIEWANADSVRSIEISADAQFHLYYLPAGTTEGEYEETDNLAKASSFSIVGVL